MFVKAYSILLIIIHVMLCVLLLANHQRMQNFIEIVVDKWALTDGR